MTLAEIISKILKYVSDEDKGIHMNASVTDIYVEDSYVHVYFQDGNTRDWVIH